MNALRLPLCSLVIVSAACSSAETDELSPPNSSDATREVTADDSLPDAASPPRDVYVNAPDGTVTDGTIVDALRDAIADAFDAREVSGNTCTVNGMSGRCLDVSECTGDQVATPGHCPGPPSIQCCTAKPPATDGAVATCSVNSSAQPTAQAGSGWCPHDPSAQPNAGLAEDPGVGGCPSGMLAIRAFCYSPSGIPSNVDISAESGGACPSGSSRGSPFCVDRFEANVVLVHADGSESPWSPYYQPPNHEIYRAVSLRGAIPQSNISGCNAKRACEASGKRLCTNEEWQRTCRGTENSTYPYGNSRANGVCNDESLHPSYSPAACFHSSASWIYSEIDYPGINQQTGTLTRTGSLPGCVSTDGVFDLMGNVHEWIYDPRNVTSPRSGVDFRGGYYNDTKINYNGCLYRTTAHDLNQVDYSIGFRCCADLL